MAFMNSIFSTFTKNSTDWTTSDWKLLAVVVGMAAALAALLVALAFVATAWQDGGHPQWVSSTAVRATTGDGTIVRARLALDAPDAETRDFARRSPAQLALMLQVAIAAFDAGSANGADRVLRLGASVRERVNEMLAARRLPPVRDVVLQDLVFSRP